MAETCVCVFNVGMQLCVHVLYIVANDRKPSFNAVHYEHLLVSVPRCEHGAMGTGSNHVPMDLITLSLLENCSARWPRRKNAGNVCVCVHARLRGREKMIAEREIFWHDL